MQAFDEIHRTVHYPADRLLYVWMSRRAVTILCILVVVPLLLAWVQYLVAGLPAGAPGFPGTGQPAAAPCGFPLWLRLTHLFNFFVLAMLARSGLSIPADHPRLYWTSHCTPGEEWIRFTPLADVYGAPLRLRVENQLGYKMVKWIQSIEFVASERDLGKGHGGKNEDDEYFDLLPNI